MYSWPKVFLLLVVIAVSSANGNKGLHDDHDENEHDMPFAMSDDHSDDSSHSEDDHHREDEHHQDDGVNHDEHNDDDDDETSHEDSSDDNEEEKMEEHQVNEHDAFLGDHVNEFKKLKPEEREKKLDQIIRSEIDTDKDGFVSEDELRTRFRQTTRTHRRREVEDTLKYHDENKDGKVSYEEFKKNHYFSAENDTAHDELKETIIQDEKRFNQADLDGDKHLSLEEYHGFYHPVDDERMAKYAIDEHLEKHDKDKDNQISFDEYLQRSTTLRLRLAKHLEQIKNKFRLRLEKVKRFLDTFNDVSDESRDELKKDFSENYDKNKDGKLTREEMRHWVLPDDEFAAEEPKKLMKEADDDKDGKLSIGEVHKHLHLFMDTNLDENDETDHDEL